MNSKIPSSDCFFFLEAHVNKWFKNILREILVERLLSDNRKNIDDDYDEKIKRNN